MRIRRLRVFTVVFIILMLLAAYGLALLRTYAFKPPPSSAGTPAAITEQARVHRVVCAIDCGRIVYPNIVQAQMEAAAPNGQITLEKGRVQQSNLGNYPLLTQRNAQSRGLHRS